MPATFACPDAPGAIPLEPVEAEACAARLAALGPRAVAWAAANGFTGAAGSVLVLPDAEGGVARVLAGWGTEGTRRRGRFPLAAAAASLAPGVYRLETAPDAAPLTGAALEEACLGWLLAAYRFDRYKPSEREAPLLLPPEGLDTARLEIIAAGAALTQDLINTPASDMGPETLEGRFRALAEVHGAEVEVTAGDALLDANFPMIHAVGRAAAEAPRLLDLRWGREDAQKVTLVGKGVCFDTGGLNIKPGASMGLMKKDMGGAANVMGLAHMIMASGLDVRLRVLVPAVENAISASAFRPGDILTSRKGLTVEVNNTDAEGRLVLADALALASEEAPETLFCLATLTGAARVALGPDIPPFYSDDEVLAAEITAAAARTADPLWRMPFWAPYESLIEPGIADLDNAPSGGMAGSVTAALFLKRFTDVARFAHFDIYGWTPAAKPGRPKGGAMQAARALFSLLEARHGRA
ncbi:leucyl aminopeptidase family protein [Paroceanicella profunda]|uniref:Leucyl aminopeptidase family protein n=1 Tax=Paroceanicella profunda TaxID=2579971 RepID=A0A5B8FXM4_9RHOB|nr:leucyl aminopeptidase family protein [Paroceanicella profunda]QDL91980.1 leucyl aminopeptidase family protein [Paroceanicella profunda]